MDTKGLQFFLVLSILGVTTGQEFITVFYTAENYVTEDDQVFSAHIVLETEPKIFLEIMDEAARIDPRFRYTTIDYGEMGHYVTSINGVYEDVTRQISWVLLKRTEDGDCRLDIGPSHFIPTDGEHVVYQLETWDIHESVPLCLTK